MGPKLIIPRRFEDERGWFAETFNPAAFTAAGLPGDFAQDNQSTSRHGVLRGLHYQLGEPQGKLLRVLSGSIWDVAVDLRHGSETCGQWFGLELAARNREGDLELLWIPEGFAHGFLVLSQEAEVHYKVTRPYDPAGEQTIIWNDPSLNIRWPLADLNVSAPLVSAKDAAGVSFPNAKLL